MKNADDLPLDMRITERERETGFTLLWGDIFLSAGGHLSQNKWEKKVSHLNFTLIQWIKERQLTFTSFEITSAMQQSC